MPAPELVLQPAPKGARYTLTRIALAGGHWKAQERASGLSLSELRAKVIAAWRPCSHAGECVFPFEACDAGASSFIIEKE